MHRPREFAQRRRPRRSYAVLWLLLVHGLAIAAVAVYRTQDVHRDLTDLFAAALARSQLCLLAMWLAAGSDRLSWRVCGLVGGGCFLFVVLTRTVFPGGYDIGAGAYWLDEEWDYYFRGAGPGDLLIKAPILIFGVAGPLLAWRIWRRMRRREESRRLRDGFFDPRRYQFGFREAGLGVVTLCLALAAVFRTPPYGEWFRQLVVHWRGVYRMDSAAEFYAVSSAWLYVVVAIASLWLVCGRTKLLLRAPIALALIIGSAYGCDLWRRSIAGASAASETGAAGEAPIADLAGVVMIGSIFLYRLYGPDSPVFTAKKAGIP